MDVIRINQDNINYIADLAIAIGQFDGLHVAHLELINTAIKKAQENNLKSGIITFDPHPDFILKKQVDNTYLTPIDEKIKLIESLHVDYLIIVAFNMDVASMEPDLFVKNYLVKLGVKEVVCGFDFSYGKYGKGKPEEISKYADNLINTTIIDEIKYNDKKIGSSLIRELLTAGNVATVKKIMGRYYSVTAKVIRGNQLGRTVGVPTANLEINDDFALVKRGVYVVKVLVNDKNYLGICNIGHNPTFNYHANLRMEIHILDFNEDIYDEVITVTFLDYIRPECQFNNIECFQKQIKKDIITAKNFEFLL